MAALCRVKALTRLSHLTRRFLSSSSQKLHIQTEPPYLDAAGPEVPEYNLVNVQMKGYDFPVLERYVKWVHNTALHMGLDVEESWATPCEKFHIQTLKPCSTKVEADYYLQVYERNVQLADLQATMAPLFIEVIQAGLPEGVELSVHEHQPEYTEHRYIPDLELRSLYSQLDEMGGPSKK